MNVGRGRDVEDAADTELIKLLDEAADDVCVGYGGYVASADDERIVERLC